MEKKSVYAICASVIIGFFILGLFISDGLKSSVQIQQPIQQETARYQYIAVGNNLIMYDTETGNSWQTNLVSKEQESAGWTRLPSPYEQ